MLFAVESKPYGLSFAEWTIKWWQWFMTIPKQRHPALDDSGKLCTQNQNDPYVWFLTGTLGQTNVYRRCIIPHGKAILCPIINEEQSFAENPSITDISKLALKTKKVADNVKKIKASLDGSELMGVEKYRIQSGPFEIILPEENIWGTRSGSTVAVGDGYWLFLKPLSLGMHNIYLFGEQLEQNGILFRIEVTYDLTVT